MTETKTEKRYVGVKETLIYGIANGGQCIGYNIMRAHMSFFLVAVFGIQEWAVSAMILVMGFWDAFNDPIMGAIVDKTRTRYGKLRPYLIFTPIPLGIVTVLFFAGPIVMGDASHFAKVVYMCVTYFIWEFFYTIGDIPFWGLSAAISPNPLDRSRVIKSARLISGIIGGLASTIITACVDLGKNGVVPINIAFLVMSIIAGTFGMWLFSLAGTHTKERVVPTNNEPKIRDCFKFLFTNRPLLTLVFSDLIAVLEGIAGIFNVYYYTLCLGMNSLSIIAGLPGTIVGWVTYPVMEKLEKRFNSRQIVVGATFFHAAVTVVVFLIGMNFYTKPIVIVPLLMILNISNAFKSSIKSVIPTKMYGETIDYMEWKTGERNEGMAFSALTLIGKLTASLATAMGTLLIPMVGLVRDDSLDMMVISPDSPINTQFWLWALITVIPTLLGLLALIPYKFYDLDSKKLETIRKEILERRGATSAAKEAE